MADLRDTRVDGLLRRLDELVRWRPGSRGEYQDLHSALSRLSGAANHVILGRRGSGKTRLIDELKRSSARQGMKVISVGAEDFKELSYPDILIQILRTFLREFEALLCPRRRVLSRAWFADAWQWLRHPLVQHEFGDTRRRLAGMVQGQLRALDELLVESDEVEAEYTAGAQETSRGKESVEAGGQMGPFSVSVGQSAESEAEAHVERRAKQREIKRTKVERVLGDFKQVLREVCGLFSTKIILAVDDFYFIDRRDQPKVVDYMHRICKDTDAFLKIATIKHRSNLFEHDPVSRGVVLGHEVQPINLELSVGNLDSITKFLTAIWCGVCAEVGIEDAQGLFMGDGFTQAVLASGGVPRDFFGVVKTALLIARERGERGIGKRRICEGARQYTQETKIPELSVDLREDEEVANLLLYDIVRFARDQKRQNCFHIDIGGLQKDGRMQNLVDALVDSRLLHLITDNTSNARRSGRYAAYLLDTGLYAYPERRGDRAVEEVEFWVRDAGGRLKNLERSPVYPLRSVEELQQAARQIGVSLDLAKEVLPDDEDAVAEASTVTTNHQQLEFSFPPQTETRTEASGTK